MFLPQQRFGISVFVSLISKHIKLFDCFRPVWRAQVKPFGSQRNKDQLKEIGEIWTFVLRVKTQRISMLSIIVCATDDGLPHKVEENKWEFWTILASLFVQHSSTKAVRRALHKTALRKETTQGNIKTQDLIKANRFQSLSLSLTFRFIQERVKWS